MNWFLPVSWTCMFFKKHLPTAPHSHPWATTSLLCKHTLNSAYSSDPVCVCVCMCVCVHAWLINQTQFPSHSPMLSQVAEFPCLPVILSCVSCHIVFIHLCFSTSCLSWTVLVLRGNVCLSWHTDFIFLGDDQLKFPDHYVVLFILGAFILIPIEGSNNSYSPSFPFIFSVSY